MSSPKGVVSSLDIVRQLWTQASLPNSVLENTLRAGNLVLTNDPVEVGQAIRSSFQLTAVAQGCCAAIALAERLRCALSRSETELDKLVLDRIEVDAQHAIAEYKGWVRLYTSHTDEVKDVKQMLKDSIAADSDEGRHVLGIDEHAVADWDALAGLYRTQPDPRRSVPGVVRIHTNFPHHKLGILQLLGLAPKTARWNDEGIHKDVFARMTREDVQRELDKWDAFEFESAAQRKGMCVTAYRSRGEWEQSEMGLAVRGWMSDNVGSSAFRISRIQSAPLEQPRQEHTRRPHSDRLKAVDMSRVIAGPISTRTLAAHGADVLLLSSQHLPNLPLRELDTARGKRTAFIDLPRKSTPPASLTELLREADVFSQAYRPSGLAERGLSAETLQSNRPGIVYAELCAFGFAGPWKDRRAYDSLTQTACGMNFLESLSYNAHLGKEEVEPKALPVQALDYAAGSLMCFATLACTCRALIERNTGGKGEGWKVQVSLASTAEWIQSLGQIHGEEAWEEPPKDVVPVEDAARMAEMVSSYRVRGLKKDAGDVRVLAIRHAAISATTGSAKEEDVRWTVPSHLGVDQLTW